MSNTETARTATDWLKVLGPLSPVAILGFLWLVLKWCVLEPKRNHKEKENEVIEEVLKAALGFLDALEEMSSVSVNAADVHDRWSFFADEDKRFSEAKRKAQTHLDNSVIELLDEIKQKRRSIEANQTTHVEILPQIEAMPQIPPYAQEMHSRGFGPKVRREIDTLRSKALEKLKLKK